MKNRFSQKSKDLKWTQEWVSSDSSTPTAQIKLICIDTSSSKKQDLRQHRNLLQYTEMKETQLKGGHDYITLLQVICSFLVDYCGPNNNSNNNLQETR